MIETLAIANYRSLRDVVLPLERLNVVSGANGTGKSSLYRSLRLLADAAEGRLVRSLAEEGGLESALWAGPETPRVGVPAQGTVRTQPIALRLGFAADDIGYAVDIGIPKPSGSRFVRDPEIKREVVWAGSKWSPPAMLADRRGGLVMARDAEGEWRDLHRSLASSESMLSHLADPQGAPIVYLLRDRIRSWRFYDHFRSDREAPARRMQVGTRTPVLSNDGRDLAAALQTILEIGDTEDLESAVQDAFPGASVAIDGDGAGMQVTMRQPGMLRPLSAAELSDGTLRYLMWLAALFTPRPPELLVVNEPETSLHPDLLPPLARLLRRASRRSQVWVVTHSAVLAEQLGQSASFALEKVAGESRVIGMGELDRPAWRWPGR